MNHEVVIVGIDLGKNWFHVIGMDRIGRIVQRRRLNRTQLGEFAATLKITFGAAGAAMVEGALAS